MYVSKKTFTAAAFLTLLFIGAVVFVLFRSSYFANLSSPEQQYDPISHFTQIVPTKTQGKVASASTINASSDGKKLTIIFFYDGYEMQKDALLYIEVMKESLDSVEPFKSMKEALSFKVFTTDSKKCRVDQKNLVCDKSLIDSFRKLGVDHFKVVLMSPEVFNSNAEYARGRNSWISISTNHGTLSEADLKRWIGILFTHFLGKSLGLFNEYEVKSYDLIPQAPAEEILKKGIVTSGMPNCAETLDTAKTWWGNYVGKAAGVGYYQGCGGDKDFYYPEENTLMSSLPKKENYGAVSTDYLRGVLSCFYEENSSITFPAGDSATDSARLSSCSQFKKQYSDFWVR